MKSSTSITETAGNTGKQLANYAGTLPEFGIIGVLLETLNGSDAFRLVDRDGEFFLEPVGTR